MHFNIINWLFQDPYTAGTAAGLTGPETFHFYIQWLIFCSAGVLIAFYYSVEGRKRFFKTRPLIKYMLDRYLGWLAIICIIGYPLIFSRAYLDPYFFAWRVWRYLWLAGLLAWAITWVVYLIRKYPKEREQYLLYQNRRQYLPKSGTKRKAASSR
jgi:formate-dependent nitrite reductase membrane component NrfD